MSKPKGSEFNIREFLDLIGNNSAAVANAAALKPTINASNLEDDPLGLFRHISHMPDGYDLGDGQYFGTQHGFIGVTDADVQNKLIKLAAQYLLDSCGGDFETALMALQNAADSH